MKRRLVACAVIVCWICGHVVAEEVMPSAGPNPDAMEEHAMPPVDSDLPDEPIEKVKEERPKVKKGPVSRMDEDGNGKISYDEFEQAHAAFVQKIFNKIDADGNGEVSLPEYVEYKVATRKERWRDRFDEIDTDGDGQITRDEMKNRPRKFAPSRKNAH